MPDSTDLLMQAARANCDSDCAGPTPAELAGLARPHSCARARGELVAAEFVGEVLSSGRALADRLAAVTMAARDVVGHECTAHALDTPDPACPVCRLLAALADG